MTGTANDHDPPNGDGARRDAEPGIADLAAASLDSGELAQFAAHAGSWWDDDGPFRPLHNLNPARLGFIRDHLAAWHGVDALARRPLSGLRVLDVGCGGGLLSEPLARMGASVTGIDAVAENIAVARAHAETVGVDVDYRHTTAEALAESGERFEVVTAMEIVEHVAEPSAFLGICADLVAPGGAMALSTLNRTAKAFALAIIGAEYVLRWVPRGTHDWRKFMRPSEIGRALRPHGLDIVDMRGLLHDPLTGKWNLSADMSVNYLIFAGRRG